MKLGENLKKFLESKHMRVADLAARSDVDPKVIYALIARNSEHSRYAPELARGLGISVDELLNGEITNEPVDIIADEKYIELTYYDIDSSAGPGRAAPDHTPLLTKLQVLEDWAISNFGRAVQSKIRLINNSGDSMFPTIADGDVLFVDVTQRQFVGDGIYVIFWNGSLLTKRLSAMFDGRLAVISDNSEYYPTQYISQSEFDNLTICGLVKKWWTLRS